MLAALLFLPGFLYYTSDMYKDGFVLFLVVTALVASFNLTHKFSLSQIIIAGQSGDQSTSNDNFVARLEVDLIFGNGFD